MSQDAISIKVQFKLNENETYPRKVVMARSLIELKISIFPSNGERFFFLKFNQLPNKSREHTQLKNISNLFSADFKRMPSDPKCGWDRNGKSFQRPKLAPSGGEDQDCRESRWQVVGAAQETLRSKATLSKAIGRRLSSSSRQRDLVAGFGWLTLLVPEKNHRRNRKKNDENARQWLECQRFGAFDSFRLWGFN